jgi:transcription elongation GreA/GreB family factor
MANTSSVKLALKTELSALLASDLETLERSHRAAVEGATHEQAKPENDKDTRALEQSYLARGQAKRIDELRTHVAEVNAMPVRDFGAEEPIAVGALITIEEDDEESQLFLAPQGGGSRLRGGEVQVVTPRSPLGVALVGKRAGEDLELRLAGKTRAIVVVGVV